MDCNSGVENNPQKLDDSPPELAGTNLDNVFEDPIVEFSVNTMILKEKKFCLSILDYS